jgi:hypothetical protein
MVEPSPTGQRPVDPQRLGALQRRARCAAGRRRRGERPVELWPRGRRAAVRAGAKPFQPACCCRRWGLAVRARSAGARRALLNPSCAGAARPRPWPSRRTGGRGGRRSGLPTVGEGAQRAVDGDGCGSCSLSAGVRSAPALLGRAPGPSGGHPPARIARPHPPSVPPMDALESSGAGPGDPARRRRWPWGSGQRLSSETPMPAGEIV